MEPIQAEVELLILEGFNEAAIIREAAWDAVYFSGRCGEIQCCCALGECLLTGVAGAVEARCDVARIEVFVFLHGTWV